MGLGSICIFMKGVEQSRIQHKIGADVYRVQALVASGQEGQHHHSLLSPWMRALVLWRIQIYYSVYPLRRHRTLLRHCTVVWLPFLCSFIPLRSLIIETCSRSSLWPGLHHKMLRPTWPSFVKKAIPSSLSLGTLWSICLQYYKGPVPCLPSRLCF